MHLLQSVCREDLQGGLVELLAREIGAREEVLMLLRGYPGEALAVTGEAVLFLKAGYAATGGWRTRKAQRVAIEDMLSAEVRGGRFLGRLVVQEFSLGGKERQHVLYVPPRSRDRFRLAVHLIRRLQEDRPGNPTVRETPQVVRQPAAEPAPPDALVLLKHLGELVRMGVVTPEEFQEKKRRLLERL